MLKEKMEWEEGLDQCVVAAIGQPGFGHHSANKIKTALLGPSGHQ